MQSLASFYILQILIQMNPAEEEEWFKQLHTPYIA